MALRLFHCESCETEFRMSSAIVGSSDVLSCPLCAEEAVEEGPALDKGSESQDEEEEEEEDEAVNPGHRSNPRHG